MRKISKKDLSGLAEACFVLDDSVLRNTVGGGNFEEYTLEEYEALIEADQWNTGGYVHGMGFVGPMVTVYGYYGYPDPFTVGLGYDYYDDLNSYWANMSIADQGGLAVSLIDSALDIIKSGGSLGAILGGASIVSSIVSDQIESVARELYRLELDRGGFYVSYSFDTYYMKFTFKAYDADGNPLFTR